MIPILVIAQVTLREAVRRKIVAACAVITVGLVGLSAWGFDRLAHNASITSGEANFAVPQALIVFMFMFSFVVVLSASAMASPAVSAEIESGVLHAVVTRPISRRQILLGKWLGLSAVIFAYAAVVTGLEIGVVDWVSGFVPPNPLLAGTYLFAEGAILLTFALLLSTRLSPIATGVVGIAVFGAAWLAGVVGSLGTAFKIASLRTVGEVARYILPPTDYGAERSTTSSHSRSSCTSWAHRPMRSATRSSRKPRHRGLTSYGSPSGSSPSFSQESSVSIDAGSEAESPPVHRSIR
jgi:ABC-type transport system involved in multi-copper enzyme maturation permease subunit